MGIASGSESTTLYNTTATAESDLPTAVATVNNANKIATRPVYDTLGVESVWANRISGVPMPSHTSNHLGSPMTEPDALHL